MDGLHECGPDGCGAAAARDLPAGPRVDQTMAVSAAVETDPDGGDVVGRESREPRISVVVRRAGFASCGSPIA